MDSYEDKYAMFQISEEMRRIFDCAVVGITDIQTSACKDIRTVIITTPGVDCGAGEDVRA